jgi:predicted ATPase
MSYIGGLPCECCGRFGLTMPGTYISKVEGDVITLSHFREKTVEDLRWEMLSKEMCKELSEWKREHLPLTNPEE